MAAFFVSKIAYFHCKNKLQIGDYNLLIKKEEMKHELRQKLLFMEKGSALPGDFYSKFRISSHLRLKFL